MSTAPASAENVRRVLIIPALIVALWISVPSYLALAVAPCGVVGRCPDDVWQTPGPYVAMGVGLVAAALVGSLFAFLPWAVRRTRRITGGAVAGAWVILTTAVLSQVR